jgi:hypothetical protein
LISLKIQELILILKVSVMSGCGCGTGTAASPSNYGSNSYYSVESQSKTVRGLESYQKSDMAFTIGEKIDLKGVPLKLSQGESLQFSICDALEVLPIQCLYPDGRITLSAPICKGKAGSTFWVEGDVGADCPESLSGKIDAVTSPKSLATTLRPLEEKCFEPATAVVGATVRGCPVGTVLPSQKAPNLVVLSDKYLYFGSVSSGAGWKRNNRSYGVTTSAGSTIISWVNPRDFSLTPGDSLCIAGSLQGEAKVIRVWSDSITSGEIGLAEIDKPAESTGCFPAIAESGTLAYFEVKQVNGCNTISLDTSKIVVPETSKGHDCSSYVHVGCYEIFRLSSDGEKTKVETVAYGTLELRPSFMNLSSSLC